MAEQIVGTVKSVVGPVVDFEFSEGALPEIYDAIYVDMGSGKRETFEVEQQLGNNIVRSVSMGSTDGLRRGMQGVSEGEPIKVPVGPSTLGRLFNVTGAPIDEAGPVDAETYYPIHRKAPSFDEQATQAELFETGVKVIDLIAPFTKGGKTGIFGGAGVGKTVVIDNSNVSGKIGLDFRPTDDTLVFVSYSKGFKSGGFNGGFLDLTDGILPENTPYDEEILNSYEIGIKTTLADGALRFNATAFYYDYQDYQALTFSGLSQFINNSDAEVMGLDLEMVWLPNDSWDISLGASFLDTEVDEVLVQGASFKGTEMVLAPEFSFNGLVRFQATEALSIQVDFNHQGEHYFDITNSDVSKEDSYTVFNARIGYKVSDNLTLAAYVKNLADEEYRVYTFDFTGPAGFNQQFYAPPRWWGVNVNYSF